MLSTKELAERDITWLLLSWSFWFSVRVMWYYALTQLEHDMGYPPEDDLNGSSTCWLNWKELPLSSWEGEGSTLDYRVKEEGFVQEMQQKLGLELVAELEGWDGEGLLCFVRIKCLEKKQMGAMWKHLKAELAVHPVGNRHRAFRESHVNLLWMGGTSSQPYS